MSDKVYSLDGENFTDYNTIIDTLKSDFGCGEHVIYEADTVIPKHTDFIDIFAMVENMRETVYMDIGDIGDDYMLDLTSEKCYELKKVIGDWFDKNTKEIDFFGVDNVGKITVKV